MLLAFGGYRMSWGRPTNPVGFAVEALVGTAERFWCGTDETGEGILSFVTADGAFLVANDPAGATVGPNVEVQAYPVQPSS
jgi:hypothetical protein